MTRDDSQTRWAHRRVGTMVGGKYRLDAVLGVGGMAVVYKATHRNRAEFAVKMLLPELSRQPDLLARFLREGYAANSVKHPGAVRVLDDAIARTVQRTSSWSCSTGRRSRTSPGRPGASCPSPLRWPSVRRCSKCSRPRTRRASCTATSSRRTSS